MKQPYDHTGRKVSRACPNPDCCGTLQPEEDKISGRISWRCDGLVDPNHADRDLYACKFEHTDGEPYNPDLAVFA